MDKRVEVHGTSRADINGKRGVATDFHFTKTLVENDIRQLLDVYQRWYLRYL